MKKITSILVVALIVGLSSYAYATPSTEFWTPDVIDIQPYGVPHLGIDDYFTVNRKLSDSGSAFPTDVGLTIGVLPFKKIQMEIGIDAFEPSDYPYLFNAKIGTPEDSLFNGSPGFSIGIFDAGTKPTVTGYNIGDAVIGKTIPYIGRLHVGYYYGNEKLLVNGEGKSENQGWMVAFDRTIVNIGQKWMDSIAFAADYASGKNLVGGGGFGLFFYFTKDIDVLTGPVWFNDTKINGRWKWTTQLDVNF